MMNGTQARPDCIPTLARGNEKNIRNTIFSKNGISLNLTGIRISYLKD